MSQAFVVQCSSELEADAAAKVVDAMRRAMSAGMLGENWRIVTQRHSGGRVKVFFEGEVDASDAFRKLTRANGGRP